MEAKFYLEAGHPKVLINKKWNALSLFLESDARFPEAKKHIELKKQRKWMGNTTSIQLLEGSIFKVYSELDIDLESVEIYQKQLLKLMGAWSKFEQCKKECTISV